MKSLAKVQVVRFRLSAWILTILSVFWTAVSVPAIGWFRSVVEGDVAGPMEWLCLFLIVVQVLLVLATIWVWIRPDRQTLVVDSGRRSNRAFGIVFIVFLGAVWISGRLDGWWKVSTEVLAVVSFCLAAILMLLDIRAERSEVQKQASNAPPQSSPNSTFQ